MYFNSLNASALASRISPSAIRPELYGGMTMLWENRRPSDP